MDTKDIYLYYLNNSDMRYINIYYTYKDNNGTIQLANHLFIELSKDETIQNKYISKMKDIENMDGFMFWDGSVIGKDFYKKHKESISNLLSKIIYNQK